MVTPIRFSSHIRFVSLDTFNKLPLDIQSDCDMVSPESVQTSGIRMCNAGGVTTPAGAFRFHLYPETRKHRWRYSGDPSLNADPKSLRKAGERIVELLNSLRLTGPGRFTQRGLLIGGDPKYAASRDYKLYLEKLFTTHQIPFSKFWGRKKGNESHIFYDVANDTWTVFAQVLNPNKPVDWVKSVADLNECFQEVVLAPGDTLELDGKLISPEVLQNAPFQQAETNTLRKQPTDVL